MSDCLPVDVNAWRKDPFVRSLDPITRDVYFHLICVQWQEHGLKEEWITGGPSWLAREIGISQRKLRSCWEKIRHKFEMSSSGVRFNSKLEKIRKSLNPGISLVSVQENPPVPATDEGVSSDLLSVSLSRSEEDLHGPKPELDFEAVYEKYPRKLGRKKGLQRCRSQIKTREKYDALLVAVKNYAATVKDITYCKHFDTFMGCWEDYLQPVAANSNGTRSGHRAPDTAEAFELSAQEKF